MWVTLLYAVEPKTNGLALHALVRRLEEPRFWTRSEGAAVICGFIRTIVHTSTNPFAILTTHYSLVTSGWAASAVHAATS